MKLSIIIPVYNVEEWIANCFNSILNQNIDFKQIEIVVVDDESPDNSLSIVESFKDSFVNFKILNQKNRGLAGARNTGIRNATGKFLLFLDPDDTIIDNCLSKMIDFAEGNHLDIAIFNQRLIKQDGSEQVIINEKLNSETCTGIELFHQRGNDSVCKYIVSRDFIVINELYFFEKLNYLEDGEWNARAFALAKRCAFNNIIFYNYILRDNSLVTSNTGIKKESFIGYFKASNNLIEFKKNAYLSEDEKFFLNNYIVKYAVLPLFMTASLKKIKIHIDAIKFISKNKIEKLPTEGLLGYRKTHGKLYNKSIIILSMYLILNSIFESLKNKFHG